MQPDFNGGQRLCTSRKTAEFELITFPLQFLPLCFHNINVKKKKGSTCGFTGDSDMKVLCLHPGPPCPIFTVDFVVICVLSPDLDIKACNWLKSPIMRGDVELHLGPFELQYAERLLWIFYPVIPK